MFSVIHLLPYAAIHLFLEGLFYGSIYYFTDSLLLPILGHFLSNTTCILVANYPGIAKGYRKTDKNMVISSTLYSWHYRLSIFELSWL